MTCRPARIDRRARRHQGMAHDVDGISLMHHHDEFPATGAYHTAQRIEATSHTPDDEE